VDERSIQRVLVLLNATAGTLAKANGAGAASERIRALFAAEGINADVRSGAVKSLCDAAHGACGSAEYGVIIAGGGDGTLNAVAGVVAEHDKVFGVLPLGTHNHFAKDMGIPLKLEDAIVALARGTVREVPVCEVNGQLFLNFSSIGVHPEVVRHRDAQRKALGRRKFFAMFIASIKVLVRFPLIRVRIAIDHGPPFARVTPSVIVGNNVHQLRMFGLVGGDYADRGTLGVFVARSRGRMGMLWLSVRALVGSLDRAETFEALSGSTARIENRHRTLHVSIDGEVTDLPPPLQYRIRAKLLKVLVPVDSAESAEASSQSA
jgi:diacylglycerol kinase family enzyme